MYLFAQALSDWHDWVNTGALAAFAVFVCWMVAKIVTHGGTKALEIGERYMRSTEALHDTLAEAERNRTELCTRHANGLETVTAEVEVSNGHLKRLVEIHEEPGGAVTESIEAIHSASSDVRRIKKAALTACEMCREIAQSELPNSAEAVSRHCDAIERIITDAR